jgi:hypothetical protein
LSQKRKKQYGQVVPRRTHAQYSNFLLPVATNLVVFVICLTAIAATARYYEHRRIEQARHESRFVTAEWQLLAQLKADTDRQLQAKDRQIAELRRRLLDLPNDARLTERQQEQRTLLQEAIETAYLERQQILTTRLVASRPPEIAEDYAVLSAAVDGLVDLTELDELLGSLAVSEVSEAEGTPAPVADVDELLQSVRAQARSAAYEDGVRAGRVAALREIGMLVGRLRGYASEEREEISRLLDTDTLYYDVAREINELAASDVPEDRLYFSTPRLLGVVVRVNLGRAEVELAGDVPVSAGQQVEFRRRDADGRLVPLCTSRVRARYGTRVIVDTCGGSRMVTANDVIYSRSERIE